MWPEDHVHSVHQAEPSDLGGAFHGHYVHCRGLAGMIRKQGVELQQHRPTTAADGAVLLLWWPDRTQPVASGSTPIMRANMQLATSLQLKMEPPESLKYSSRILQQRRLSAQDQRAVQIYHRSRRISHTSRRPQLQPTYRRKSIKHRAKQSTNHQVKIRQASTHCKPHLQTTTST